MSTEEARGKVVGIHCSPECHGSSGLEDSAVKNPIQRLQPDSVLTDTFDREASNKTKATTFLQKVNAETAEKKEGKINGKTLPVCKRQGNYTNLTQTVQS